jgi:DNA polymerase III epsilon subunit-like protein
LTKPPTYSRHGPGKNILILDTETSGSSFGSYEDTFKQYQAVSFGAIVADNLTFQPIAKLYFTVKFDGTKYEWSESAEKVHGLSREQLEAEGLDDEEAAATLAEFILTHFGTGKVMFAGHNPYFDIEAMRQLLEKHGVMPDLYHVVIDTSGTSFVAIGKYRSNDVFEIFCGERRDKHNALSDAELTLTVLQSIKALCTAGAESLGIQL